MVKLRANSIKTYQFKSHKYDFFGCYSGHVTSFGFDIFGGKFRTDVICLRSTRSLDETALIYNIFTRVPFACSYCEKWVPYHSAEQTFHSF